MIIFDQHIKQQFIKLISAIIIFLLAVVSYAAPTPTPYVAANYYQVSAGVTHSCVLDDNGVHCWGSNFQNQTDVPALIHPVAVDAGGAHTCAIDDSGVNCWGDNGYGQSTVPSLTHPTTVSAGYDHTCAIDDAGLHCWGYNGYGQTNVPTLTNPTAVSAKGGFHTCAIDDAGVHCWGSNLQGQTNVPALTHPVAVSAGGQHTCALDDSGVHCWGSNLQGQTNVPALVHPVAVSAGDDHTCALDDSGVHCWGKNNAGQTTVPSLTNPKSLSAGGNHTCALDDSGLHLHCWGDNYYGQSTTSSMCLTFNAITVCTTPTPTPTITPTPTNTPSPTATYSPTPIYTPTVTPMSLPTGTPPTPIPGEVNKVSFAISPNLTSSGTIYNGDTSSIVEHGPTGRRIATNNAGLFLHVNNEFGNIYGQYTQSGFVSGFKFLVATGATYADLQEISVDMNNAGVAVVAWNNNGTIKAQIIPANTTVLTLSPITIGTGDGVSLSASIDQSGNFGVTWSSGQNLYLKTFNNAGSAMSNAVLVSSGCVISTQLQQAILGELSSSSTCAARSAMNNNGLVVVWNEQRHIYARRYNNSAVSVGSQFQVDNTPNDVGVLDNTYDTAQLFGGLIPVVAMDETNAFSVAWHRFIDKANRVGTYQWEHHVNAGIVVQQFNAADQPSKKDSQGNAVDFVVALDKNTNVNPDISMNEQGAFAIVWQNQMNKKMRLCVSFPPYRSCGKEAMPVYSVKFAKFTSSDSGIKKLGSKTVAKGVNTSPGDNLIAATAMTVPAIAIDNESNVELEWVKEQLDLNFIFTSPYDYYINYQIGAMVMSQYYSN